MNLFDFLNDGMSEDKFKQRLDEAFDNHLLIRSVSYAKT